jgi:NAD(P)-dependent dehydrogenase (short-subunit alcohol dehydrogenase family)
VNTIVITGSSSGIDRSTAKRFAATVRHEHGDDAFVAGIAQRMLS